MDIFELIATGEGKASRTVTNRDLEQVVDTSDEWIYTRSGIRERRFCGPDETAASLAVRAARQALARSGLGPGEIGCLVVGTLSGDWQAPSMACMLQAELGLGEDIPVLDINAACSGFLYGAVTARGLLLQDPKGRRHALVVGVEKLSSLLDMRDRSTCVLFGDGAGAAVFALVKEEAPYASLLGARGGREITLEGPAAPRSRVRMDGKAVFRFAVQALPHCLQELLRQAGLGMDGVDWVVCHQANRRIIDFCIKRLAAPPEKFFQNMERYGNTSAASIPIALNEMAEKGLFTGGKTVALVGFGAGLTWGGLLCRVRLAQEEKYEAAE